MRIGVVVFQLLLLFVINLTNTETDTEINTNTEINVGIHGTDTEKADKIIEIMREQPAVTVKKIAEQIGLSISGVRYHVNKLKKDGIVEHIGSSKKGRWVIHKS